MTQPVTVEQVLQAVHDVQTKTLTADQVAAGVLSA